MKKSVIFIFLLFSINVYAYNVRVFFTNNTPDKFRPLAVINYNKDGIPYEKYIEPEVPVIDAYAQNVRIDQDRIGVENYYMVWFELNDEQNRYRDACLESYLALSRSSDIYFTLSRDDEMPSRNVCEYKVIPR